MSFQTNVMMSECVLKLQFQTFCMHSCWFTDSKLKVGTSKLSPHVVVSPMSRKSRLASSKESPETRQQHNIHKKQILLKNLLKLGAAQHS